MLAECKNESIHSHSFIHTQLRSLFSELTLCFISFVTSTALNVEAWYKCIHVAPFPEDAIPCVSRFKSFPSTFFCYIAFTGVLTGILPTILENF